MVTLIRTLHIYSGLVILVALLVSSLSGLHVMNKSDPREKAPVVKTLPFNPPDGASDAEIAQLIREQFGFFQSKPVPHWAIDRTDGVLTIPLWSPNGYVTVRYQGGGEAEVTIDEFGFGEYVNQMHTHLPLGKRAIFAWIWSAYMELAIFGLAFLALSGVYLWAVTRPKLWWAGLSLAAGTGALVYFYVAMS